MSLIEGNDSGDGGKRTLKIHIFNDRILQILWPTRFGGFERVIILRPAFNFFFLSPQSLFILPSFPGVSLVSSTHETSAPKMGKYRTGTKWQR